MPGFDNKEAGKNVNRDVYKSAIDPAIIKKDPKGNAYVAAYDTLKIADDAFNEQWSLEINKCWSETIGDYDIVFYACVTISVPGFGNRSAVGGASFRDILRRDGRGKSLSELTPKDVQPTRTSDLYKLAVTDGMKKALSLFQICAEVYAGQTNDEKMKLDVERPQYGATSKPAAAKPAAPKSAATERLALSEKKAAAKAVYDRFGLKKMSDLTKALDAAGIETLTDETLDVFSAYLQKQLVEKAKHSMHSGDQKKTKEEKKDIPV